MNSYLNIGWGSVIGVGVSYLLGFLPALGGSVLYLLLVYMLKNKEENLNSWIDEISDHKY